MTSRIYFVMSNPAAAQLASKQLLLAKIDSHQMHFMAKKGTNLGQLPLVHMAQKTDLIHGAQLGGVIGLALGLAVGWYIYAWMTPPAGMTFEAAVVLVSALVGAALGAWISSMIGASRPNSRHRRFEKDLAAGRVLLMIDAPTRRAEELRDLLLRSLPGTKDGGMEPAIPVFP
jgi:hypothetical protein